MPITDWLLVLGSNSGGQAKLLEAVCRLEDIGKVALLGGPLITTAEPPAGPDYVNALVMLRSSIADLEGLEARLKQIEISLGRDCQESGKVVLDIDVLAINTSLGWLATRRVSAKRELKKAYIEKLMMVAAVIVRESL